MAVLAKKTDKLALKPYSFYTLKCPHCGKLNPEDAINCWNCGYSFMAKKEKRSSSPHSYLWIWFVLGFLLIGWLVVVFWVKSIVL
ncbi:hypothetical protein J7K05_01485 [bacterium]|nr:hypothetical protein [bacterium]